MNQRQRLFARVTGAALSLAAPLVAFAQSQVILNGQTPFDRGGGNGFLGQAQTASGVGTQAALPIIIGRVINVVLGFMGIVLLFYVLRAGFSWMTAGGDSKKVDEAKDMIRNAVIGLVIIIAGFAISNFVLSQLSAISVG